MESSTMKFAAIEVHGKYTALVRYGEMMVTSSNFRHGGQQIEFRDGNGMMFMIIYGRIIDSDTPDKIRIEIAE